jgi:predicted nuclease of restriction endonuclease-like (RecB) superfamily
MVEPIKPAKHGAAAPKYDALIHGIGVLLEDARRNAARRVNSILTSTYWEIGRRIIEFEQSGSKRAGYGKNLLRNISRDLTSRYGRGFDESNVRHMRKFYILYQKWDAARPEFPLTWTHYRLLLSIESDNQREFYETECEHAGWSSRQLDRQMNSLLYERTRLSRRKELVLERARSESSELSPEDEIKDPYLLDFLDLSDDHSESELEEALIRRLEDFLLELGVGFAFVARQKTIFVGDQRFKVDLLLYHIGLQCLVVLDLKVGPFSHADAGQMNFYLNYFRDHQLNGDDNPPVGIILCADKDDAVVRYALGGLQNKIFASRYRLRLPEESVLRSELKKEKERFLERKARDG